MIYYKTVTGSAAWSVFRLSVLIFETKSGEFLVANSIDTTAGRLSGKYRITVVKASLLHKWILFGLPVFFALYCRGRGEREERVACPTA
jgi:hypothetical protein